MKNIVLLSAFAIAQVAAFGQGSGTCGVFNGVVFQATPCTISSQNQTLAGTWIAQVAQPGGTAALFEVGTYHVDGSYSGANVNGLHSEHKGVWMRVGDRKFLFTFMFFTCDDKGVFNGIVKARGSVTLAEDGKSYESVVERVVMDSTGKELSVTSGITGRSVRMDLELSRTPATQ
ncbi:MAG: hypothetical protein ABI759_09720 [Candidatus Solibacter sp.]